MMPLPFPRCAAKAKAQMIFAAHWALHHWTSAKKDVGIASVSRWYCAGVVLGLSKGQIRPNFL